MPQIKDSKTLAAAALNDRRPPAVSLSAPAAASPELLTVPSPTFTAQDKLRILAEVDAGGRPGAVGAIVRREGFTRRRCRLRRQRAGRLRRAKPRQARPKPLNQTRWRRNLRFRGGRTSAEAALARAETIIELQKKVAALLAPSGATAV